MIRTIPVALLPRHVGGLRMDDALYLGLTVGFFLLTWALVKLCELV
jgi:hypothetical protein